MFNVFYLVDISSKLFTIFLHIKLFFLMLWLFLLLKYMPLFFISSSLLIKVVDTMFIFFPDCVFILVVFRRSCYSDKRFLEYSLQSYLVGGCSDTVIQWVPYCGSVVVSILLLQIVMRRVCMQNRFVCVLTMILWDGYLSVSLLG